jgi:hypothetical protein
MTLGERIMAATGAMSNEIVIEFIVKRRIDRIQCAHDENRITVWRRAHDGLGPDIAAAARPILDNKGIAKPLRQPLPDQARDDVGRTAGGGNDHDPHRPRRIGLRAREARYSRQRDSARCEMQELATGKFHFEPPSQFTSLDHLVGAGE